MIEGYLNSPDRDIRLIFLLIDMRHKPSADDMHMIDYLIEAEHPFVIVLTKADKLNKTQRQERLSKFPEEIGEDIKMIPFSSTTFEGVEELRKIIDEVSAE